jgi:four helix bundle protein
MSNIAEGFESRTRPFFIEFLGRAKASAGEVRSQLYTALDANYLSKEEFNEIRDLAKKASSQISRLMTYLRSAATSDSVSEDLPQFNSQTF